MIDRLFGVATTRLGWTPAAFWSAGPREFWAAVHAVDELERAKAEAMKSARGGRR